MSLLLDAILDQASNGSPATVALSSESVAVALFASGFLEFRSNWLDRKEDQLDEVTDADWDAIEKLVGNLYDEIMTPIDLTPIGSMVIWPTDTIPDKWLLCDGQFIDPDVYEALFDLIGTVYGFDSGTGFFAVPDMRDRLPMGANGIVGLGATSGSQFHTLSEGELPPHNHGVTDPGHNHDQQIGASPAYLGIGGTGRVAYSALTTSSLTRVHTDNKVTGISTNDTGNGDEFPVLNPVLGLNYIIYAGV